jgi:hypothetical protein
MSSTPHRIVVEIFTETAAVLDELVARCNESHRDREGANTHGELTAATLLAMLAEDAGLVIRRPGSWEGANMAQVLISHGYDVC